MLKFQAEDANPGSIVEAAVDDIFVYDKAVINSVNNVQKLQANIYPNPANNTINVKLSHAAAGYIALYDLTGKQITKVDMTNQTDYQINTASVAAGTYFITIKSDKFIQAHKVSIAH